LVEVRESDFTMSTTVGRVRAGLVTFRIHNEGPSSHEFVIDRADVDVDADAVPLRPNGLSIDEGSTKLQSLGHIEGIRLGATRDLTVQLKTGHYVLFCNYEGHYRGGMYASLDVTT
jgi:uncharacterized cupredoxin-like copper-binding protein